MRNEEEDYSFKKKEKSALPVQLNQSNQPIKKKKFFFSAFLKRIKKVKIEKLFSFYFSQLIFLFARNCILLMLDKIKKKRISDIVCI